MHNLLSISLLFLASACVCSGRRSLQDFYLEKEYNMRQAASSSGEISRSSYPIYNPHYDFKPYSAPKVPSPLVEVPGFPNHTLTHADCKEILRKKALEIKDRREQIEREKLGLPEPVKQPRPLKSVVLTINSGNEAAFSLATRQSVEIFNTFLTGSGILAVYRSATEVVKLNGQSQKSSSLNSTKNK